MDRNVTKAATQHPPIVYVIVNVTTYNVRYSRSFSKINL